MDNFKTTYSYDKEADILYISFSPGEKATATVELNENIILRFNFAEERAIGITLIDFSILTQSTDLGPRHFPLSGLVELGKKMQKIVTEMIVSAPVNQVLKVATFTPPAQKAIPIISVEQMPVSQAI